MVYLIVPEEFALLILTRRRAFYVKYSTHRLVVWHNHNPVLCRGYWIVGNMTEIFFRNQFLQMSLFGLMALDIFAVMAPLWGSEMEGSNGFKNA